MAIARRGTHRLPAPRGAVAPGAGADDPARSSPPAALRRLLLRALVPAVPAVILLAGGAFLALEADTVNSFGDGVLWALSLMTTVGFAGGLPHTAVAKVLAAILMVLGFAILAVTTAAIASLFVRDDEEPIERREADFERSVMRELASLASRLEAIEGRLREGVPRPGRGRGDGPPAASPRRPPERALIRPLVRTAHWIARPPDVSWGSSDGPVRHRRARPIMVQSSRAPRRGAPDGRPAPEAA